MTVSKTSKFIQDFGGKPLTAQQVETIRGEWLKHDDSWLGFVHKGAKIAKNSTGALMAASAAVPGFGWAAEIPESIPYAIASVTEGLTAHFGKNNAVRKNGGTEEQVAGAGTAALEVAKAAIPFVN